MAAAAKTELLGSAGARKMQLSNGGGGRRGYANGASGAASGGRKKPPAKQGSLASAGRVDAAGGHLAKYFHQINKQVIDAAENEDMVALLRVINHNIAGMNLVNLSTSLHRIAKLAAAEEGTQAFFRANDVIGALLTMMQSKLYDATLDSSLHQALSNIAWSLATLQIEHDEVLLRVADLACKDVDGFKPFELATLIWAFAKLSGNGSLPQGAKRVFFAAANRISRDLRCFSFRSLANIIWAFATTGVRHRPLFMDIAKMMIYTADSANCQGIANTIWAFSTAGHNDVKLFNALTQAALPIMHDFKAHELSSMLWGLAISGFVKEEVWIVSLDAIRGMDLGPQQLANVIWAYAKVLPNNSMTHAAVVHLLPRVAAKFMAFKLQEVSSVMQALAKIAAMDREDAAAVLNGAWRLPSPVYQSIYEFLRFATPWIEERLYNLPSHIFTSVVCLQEFFGFAQDRNLAQLMEQQVIARVDRLPCEEIIQLLGALLSSRASSQAVCVLAGRLAANFQELQPQQRQQLRQVAVAAFNETRLHFSPHDEKLYSWCLALAITQPMVSQGSTAGALAHDESALSDHGDERSVGKVELPGPRMAQVDSSDSDSILSLEPGEFTRECRLASIDSLPNFPNTPEDSDDEYYTALVARQASTMRSVNSSCGGDVANSNFNHGTLP